MHNSMVICKIPGMTWSVLFMVAIGLDMIFRNKIRLSWFLDSRDWNYVTSINFFPTLYGSNLHDISLRTPTPSTSSWMLLFFSNETHHFGSSFNLFHQCTKAKGFPYFASYNFCASSIIGHLSVHFYVVLSLNQHIIPLSFSIWYYLFFNTSVMKCK
jgi:hypothetical protein